MVEKKKKSVKHKEEDTKKKEISKSSDENTSKIIIISVIIFVLGLGIWAYTVYSSAHFKYMGVEFDKVRQGKIDFYTAKLPAIDNAGNTVSYTNIDFRSNPQSLVSVPTDFKTPVQFVNNKKVYVSVSGNLSNCQGYSGIALINFGRLLSLFGLKAQGAVDDPAYEGNNNTPYVNCNTNPFNTVIMIGDGEETKVEQTRNNCYEITFTNCEILRAVERFELQVMSEYVEKVEQV